MFVLEALLTLLTDSDTSLFQTSKIFTNTTVCPTQLSIRHELCSDVDCTYPILLNETTFEIPISLCVDMIMQSRICTTEPCLSIATRLIESIDDTVDPCDDFYNFVCGKFINSSLLAPDSELGYFSTRNNEVLSELKILVSEPIKVNEDYSSVVAKTLFSACMNISAIKQSGQSVLLNILNRFGGWPIQDPYNWDSSNFNWLDFVEKCRTEGYPLEYFYTLTTMNWPHDDSTRYLFLDAPVLELDHVILSRGTRTTEAQALLKRMEDIAGDLGLSSLKTTQELQNVLNFEVEIAKLIKNYNQYPQIMTVYDLERLINLPWYVHLNKLLYPFHHFNSNEKILVRIDFMTELAFTIQLTPKETLANYALWRVIRDSLNYLTYNPKESKIRASICERLVSTKLPYATAAMFIRKHHVPKLKAHVTEIFDRLRQQLTQNLLKLTWMEKQDRDEIMQRLNTIDFLVGFPSNLVVNNHINDYYNRLHVSSDNYIESIKNITIHRYDYFYKKPWQSFNESACRGIEYEDAMQLIETMGSYTYCKDNTINLRLPIVSGDFFSEFRPDYLNYGTLGVIIGHELTHVADKMFNLNKVSRASRTGYEQQVECLYKQFTRYNINGRWINAQRTEMENVADLNGYKIAYDAFIEYTNKNKNRDPVLSGLLNYTANQLFWISAAFPSCTVYSDDGLNFLLDEDEHAPAMFRVNGPIRNLKSFAADFNCPLGKKMNPSLKCSPVYAPP